MTGEDLKRIMADEKICAVVNGVIDELERLLNKEDICYTEDLHELLTYKLDCIAETQYRIYLGKMI